MSAFFEVTRWHGEPTNQDPHKCAALAWFDLNRLPDDLVAYARNTIGHWRARVVFSQHARDLAQEEAAVVRR